MKEDTILIEIASALRSVGIDCSPAEIVEVKIGQGIVDFRLGTQKFWGELKEDGALVPESICTSVLPIRLSAIAGEHQE